MRRALSLLLLLPAACADQSKLTPEERGRAVYATYQCRRCHRIGAEGGENGPDLSFAGFRKSAEFFELWLKDPSAWQPDTLMPDFHLRDEARRDVAAYLATLKGEEYRKAEQPWNTPALRADPLRRGAEIYSRAGCAACHGRGGRGGYKNNNVPGGEIPKLTGAAQGFSKTELIRKIAQGVPAPAPADPKAPPPLLAMPSWGKTLTEDEIAAVADYLLSLGGKPAAADDW